jgi:GNAT superfamily N-acetyltransferase
VTADYRLRRATAADVAPLQALIAASVRGLSAGFYTPAQAEGGLHHVFGVDTQLVADGTYYVVEADGGLAAAGGWSARRTLFGGDQMKGAADPRLDPAVEPARIRAFFVHPDHARRGLGRRLFAACEADARAAGFRSFELMGTLPGVPLYTALGFAAHERVDVPLDGGEVLPCIRMTRPIGGAEAGPPPGDAGGRGAA